MVSDLAGKPTASLPEQMGNLAATKAAYRFLESPKISYERLMHPHVRVLTDGK